MPKLINLMLLCLLPVSIEAGEFPIPHQSIIGIVLESTDRKQLQDAFGTISYWERHDSRHDPKRFCYRLSGENQAWIVFGLGWAWGFKKVDSVLVTTHEADIEGECLSISIKVSQVTTDGGLALSLTSKSVLSIVGNQPTIEGDKYTYKYESYIKYDKPRIFKGNSVKYIGEYNYGSIDVRFTSGKVSSFYLWSSGEPDW